MINTSRLFNVFSLLEFKSSRHARVYGKVSRNILISKHLIFGTSENEMVFVLNVI